MHYQEQQASFVAVKQTLAKSAFCQLFQRGELAVVEVNHPRFKAEILLQGAQMIAFAPTGEPNWLWLSEEAAYRKGTSLRGGIPVCWPWFGNACKNPLEVQSAINTDVNAPAHGFARTQNWEFGELYEAADRVELSMVLRATQSNQTIWRGEADVTARWIMTANSLTVSLTTRNTGRDPVAITQALHTYFPTSDIHQTRLGGLHRQSYLDTLDNWRRKTQSRSVSFTAETDRIYYTSPDGHHLSLTTPEHTTRIDASGSQSCIVWNPWIEKASRLSQFANNAWQRMVCAETANAADNWVNIAPSQSHTMAFTLSRV